jgi:hypothetical protein
MGWGERLRRFFGGQAGRRVPANPAFFTEKWTPSPELAAIVGAEPLPLPDVTARVWSYVLKHKLRDPKNHTLIHLDDALTKVYGKRKHLTAGDVTDLGEHLIGPGGKRSGASVVSWFGPSPS